jgi:hypothetical protein
LFSVSVCLGGVLEAGADEVATRVIGPGVEGAGEDQVVALVVAADLLTAVAAGVQERADLLVSAIAHNDDFLGAHAADNEVTGVRNLTLVAEQQPAALEDLLHLLVEDVRVNICLPANRATFGVDE